MGIQKMKSIYDKFPDCTRYSIDRDYVYMYADPLKYFKMLEAIRAGKKIEAIKIHRAHNGAPLVGLKESKEFVESVGLDYSVKMIYVETCFKEEYPEYFL